MSRIWFNVPLCDECFSKAKPDREPYHLILPDETFETCSRCGVATIRPVYVRVCYPPQEVEE